MTLMQWLMVSIFAATFIGLLKYQQRPDRVFALAMLTCLALSLVSSQQMLINAVNPGLVTLILLVLCSFAIERTSLLRKLSTRLFNGSEFKSTLKTLLSATLASAFMNNIAVVATLLGPIKNNAQVNPGKLLLPLSFAAILGGTLTLVGTSTNLIVNSMLIDQGGTGLAFFDFTLVGIAVSVCCLVVVLLRQHTLPTMDFDAIQTPSYFVEAEVSDSSKLIGKSVEENGLRNLDTLFLVEVIRAGRLISPVTPDEVLQAHDKLIFSGDITKVLMIQQFDGLTLFAEQDGLLRDNLTEVLIKPDSAVIGKTLKTAGFRARFDAAVVAFRREGGALSGKLGDIVIQSGDYLVLAVGKDFSARTNLSKNFYILSGHQADNMLRGWRDNFTLFGFLVAIACSVLFSIALLNCLIFYITFLILTNCLNVNEIKRRFPLEIWVIVLSALTLANALENTGVALVIAQKIEYLLQAQSIYLAFVAIFILTLLITEFITNTAAAALAFPIAYNIALGLGGSPLPFVMAVAFAASGSFISPYGYQTNVMVFNAGNYRLSEFVKFGLPVSVVYTGVAIFMIPMVFPF